jgi:hypothetical protein
MPSATARLNNGFAERLIGSIRRECLDHIIVLGEGHLRQVLKYYVRYHNESRTHLSLDKMRPSRVLLRSAAALLPALFLADCIINIAGFEFSKGTRDRYTGGDAGIATEAANDPASDLACASQ